MKFNRAPRDAPSYKTPMVLSVPGELDSGGYPTGSRVSSPRQASPARSGFASCSRASSPRLTFPAKSGGLTQRSCSATSSTTSTSRRPATAPAGRRRNPFDAAGRPTPAGCEGKRVSSAAPNYKSLVVIGPHDELHLRGTPPNHEAVRMQFYAAAHPQAAGCGGSCQSSGTHSAVFASSGRANPRLYRQDLDSRAQAVSSAEEMHSRGAGPVNVGAAGVHSSHTCNRGKRGERVTDSTGYAGAITYRFRGEGYARCLKAVPSSARVAHIGAYGTVVENV